MKKKILMGIGGLFLASSSMFAGWGVSVGAGGGYWGPRAGVVIASRPAYRPYYYAPRPYVMAPVPYGYVARAPVYVAPLVASIWIAPHWEYRPAGRIWVRGHYGRR